MKIAIIVMTLSLITGIAAMWMHYLKRYEISNALFLMFDIGIITTILIPVVFCK